MIAQTASEIAAGLFYALAVGAALGAFYDVFRVLRLLLGLRPNAKEVPRARLPLIGEVVGRKSRSGVFAAAVVFVCDLAFFAVATAVYDVLIFHAAYGQNRWFYSAAALLGFSAYLLTVGKLVMRASGAIRFALCAAVKYLLFFAALPFRLAYKYAICPLARTVSSKFGEKRTKNALKALDKQLTMVYNIDER